jgi:hypothetical protein
MNPIYNPYVLGNRDEPPYLYSLMNSMVNFDKKETEKVKIEDLSTYARNQIFNFDYPLDPILKPTFEKMFLDHYLFRRIGFETYTAWHLHLKVKLNDIMSKYNVILKDINNLTIDGRIVTENKSITENNSSTSNITNSGTTDNRYSDTPENSISDIRSGDYVSDYTYNQTTGSSTGNATGNTAREESKTLIDGDKLDEYLKIQDKLKNIYSRIFKECDSLFYVII